MISNCGHDENGRYSGGQAGDQKGDEWAIINWYNRPWSHVIRHPDEKVRKKIAELARAAALNNKIGYDQSQRTTFWTQLKSVGYDPSKITAPCETDCSSGVATIVKATGYLLDSEALKNVSVDSYSGNIRAVLSKAGFKVLTETKYTKSSDYLLEGDILLYEGHHVATNLDDGSKVSNVSETTSATESATVSTIDVSIIMSSLVLGSKGSQVKTLQRLLKSLGYYSGNIDGDFGKQTKSAVENFQAEKGISVTYPGTVGSKTWSFLLTKC